MNEHLLWAIFILAVLIAGVLGVAFYELLKQQGRVLLRLHEINLRLSALSVQAVPGALSPASSKSVPDSSLERTRIERNGLKAGTPAPDFTLPDLQGGTISLHDYRGHGVLLIFTDPSCAPCDELLLQLRRSYSQFLNGGPRLLIVGRGDAVQNRAKSEALALPFPMVLQKQWELSRAYGIFATPVGFLIGADGVIERDVARGTTEILALAAGREVGNHSHSERR